MNRFSDSHHLALCLIWAYCLVIAGCVTPSKKEMHERAKDVERIQKAYAVHLPPGRDSCVGVVLRLAEQTVALGSEQAELNARITEEEIEKGIEAAGLEACQKTFESEVSDLGIQENLEGMLHYAIDPEGQVCAVVELTGPEPIDADAYSALENARMCAKKVLFKAEFPKNRVKDKERIVRKLNLGS